MKFCSKHNIHLVSDEIYALTVFDTGNPDAKTFTSVLSIDPTDIIDPALLHVEYGFSKDFGAPGLHLAALVTTNEEVQKVFTAIGLLQAPGGPSCHIGTLILEDEKFVEDLVALSRTKLAENYKAVTGILDEAGISYWRRKCGILSGSTFRSICLRPPVRVIWSESSC
jgi:1-aminocyclopropane-1-carboxylate synthase